VEAISHSRFWSNSVIFIIEDDPQSGFDHVDGHRSICMVVSPYTKRGQTISSFYNQPGVLHTIEQILGLPPMNQMDAIGPLMTDCFVPKPDFTPFNHVTPATSLTAAVPPLEQLTGKARYWAMKSMKLDLSGPDRANPNTLSRVLWFATHGEAPFPTKFVGTNKKTWPCSAWCTSNPRKRTTIEAVSQRADGSRPALRSMRLSSSVLPVSRLSWATAML
jgi:hypothetical protein